MSQLDIFVLILPRCYLPITSVYMFIFHLLFAVPIFHLYYVVILSMQACICQGDAFLALNKFDLAKQSYLTSLDIEPSIRHSKSFKVMFNVLLYV